MRVIMPASIDQAGRQFNVDEAVGVNRRHRAGGPLRMAPGRPAVDSLTGGRDCWAVSRRSQTCVRPSLLDSAAVAV
jgi:hypothetical protein